MPVYLCQPGQAASEPWRHGIQVYATPFLMDGGRCINNSSTSGNAAPDVNVPSSLSPMAAAINNNNNNMDGAISAAAEVGTPIRRIRHAEVVLVDDVCVAYGRHWLRLRWPGRRHGGFAGYIALGRINDDHDHSKGGGRGSPEPSSSTMNTRQTQQPTTAETAAAASALGMTLPGVATSMSREQVIAAAMASNSVQLVAGNNAATNHSVSFSATAGRTLFEADQREVIDDDDIAQIDSSKDDEPQDNASTQSAEPLELSSPMTDLVCVRNGLIFPSSVAMKLLSMYDDGFTPSVVSAPLPSETVFCRICREGLHEDADEEQPTPAVENDADESGAALDRGRSHSGSSDNLDDDGDRDVNQSRGDRDDDDEREPAESEPIDPILSKGPILPHPTYHANPHAAENPMLSPCECSGSMAFVHYMCIEQWRCRSRHPDARQGLSCETCGKPYALPPPSARPANVMQPDNEDWLEAMPPHVLEALRRPHIWWQVGAAVVRRRWLRPIAPVVMSPIVALYCRARRMLKKRGVARRRWACSLCRRRARWKCVRCLRSYYCSRQCQNVSWHIVHKHVCYKPSRWAWSLVFYGAVFLLAFPGSLRDPMMYDLGLAAIPTAFYLAAVIGGGFATAMKKGAGVDLRGRLFETGVVIATVYLVLILWGLIGGFFGQTSKCHGALTIYSGASSDVDIGAVPSSLVLQGIHRLILLPAQNWFRSWDKIAMAAPTRVRRVLCMPDQKDGCFEYAYKANASFIEDESKCASDLMLFTGVVTSAVFIGSISFLWKQRERQRRAARRVRPHQD